MKRTTSRKPAFRGFGGQGFTDQLTFSRGEKTLLALTFGAAVLINVAWINSKFGLLLLAFEALVSMSNPLSALMALSASQISADPLGWPLTTAQTLVLVWPVQVIVRGKLRHAAAATKMIAVIIPYYALSVVAGLINWHAWEVGNPFDLALIVGVIGAMYVSELNGRYRAGLFATLLGASPAILGYWFYRAGLDFVGTISEYAVRGATQIGFGRSDWNTAGVNIALAVAGLAALALSQGAHGRESWRESRAVGWLAVAAVGLGIPAVLGTMSRGCLVNVMVSLGAVALVVALKPPSAASRRAAFALAVLSFGIFGVESTRTDFSERLLSEIDFSRSEGTPLLSRDEVFKAAVRTIVASPALGETPETAISIAGYEGGYCSHNVFLDVGRGSGIPGMFLYAIFFFYPVYQLVKRRGWTYAFPFLISYLSMFLTFMNLSLGNHKTFFVLWNLMTLAAWMPLGPGQRIAVRVPQVRRALGDRSGRAPGPAGRSRGVSR